MQRQEALIQQRQQVVEGNFVARVRRGGEQDQMPVLVPAQALQQLKAKLLAGAAAGAGVGLVHDDAFGRRGDELLAVAFALDVVQAHHHHGVMIEQSHPVRQFALDTRGGRCRERDGMEVEPGFELGLPLLDQVGWAQNSETGNFASVHQLAGNQPGFNGFADAHVVGNQQTNCGQTQGH